MHRDIHAVDYSCCVYACSIEFDVNKDIHPKAKAIAAKAKIERLRPRTRIFALRTKTKASD